MPRPTPEQDKTRYEARKLHHGWTAGHLGYWTQVRKRYDLTGDELSEVRKLLIIRQKFKCAIPSCPRDFERGGIANLDHDNKTHELRGALCFVHNRWLSNMRENDLLDLLEYLRNPPARTLLLSIIREVKSYDAP